jgi:hypothetical protein
LVVKSGRVEIPPTVKLSPECPLLLDGDDDRAFSFLKGFLFFGRIFTDFGVF